MSVLTGDYLGHETRRGKEDGKRCSKVGFE